MKESHECFEKYEDYQKIMEESDQPLMDADARLMKSKMTNQITDHGLMNFTLNEISDEKDGIMEMVADRGYESKVDMVKCFEDSISPYVITDNRKDMYELELLYE